MKKTLVTFAATVLLLAGCSSTSNEEPEAPEETASSETTQVAEEPATDPTEEPTEEPEEELEKSDEPERSARGNVIKEIGEEGQLVTGVNDDVTFRLSITEIMFDADCGTSEKPANGHFVQFNIEAETTEHWPADEHIQVTMHDFRAWDADGTRINDITSTVYSCDVGNYFPPEPFRPSDKVRGSLMFDLPDTSYIAYEPWGDGGWEWLVERGG